MTDEVLPEQPENVDEWLALHGDSLDPAARAQLERLKLGVTVQETPQPKDEEPESWTDYFEERVWKAMKWVGIIGAGALIVGGGAYAVKQATDSFPTAVETAVKRELKERTEVVKKAISDIENASGVLLMKLLDFIIALKDKGSTFAGISGMAVTAWEGIWSDAKEYVTSGDTSPDETLKKIKEIVTSDPTLSSKMDGIFAAYNDLTGKKDALERVANGISSVTDQDESEFLRDWKQKFWEEMRGKGPQLKTPTKK